MGGGIIIRVIAGTIFECLTNDNPNTVTFSTQSEDGGNGLPYVPSRLDLWAQAPSGRTGRQSPMLTKLGRDINGGN